MKALRILSVLVWVVLTIAFPSRGGSDNTVYVSPPNGKDDTASIQAALDTCVARGPGCTVQLLGGGYLTKQIVVYNFQGTFKGMGTDSTAIEALPNLHVDMEPNAASAERLCQPNTTTCLWPSVILFVDGDIHVSDLSIYITAPPGTATTTWYLAGSPFIGLYDALSFMGQHANAYIDRIHMEGLPDPTNAYGFNVLNALHFTGEFPRSLTRWDWYFLSGSLTVRNSSFKNATVGVSQDGFVTSSRITVGGSPTAGNHFEDLYGGIDIEASENSVVEVSYNQSSGTGAAMWVVPWQPVFVPTSRSQYLIHDNKFFATGQYAEGMYLYDYITNPWIRAKVWNNTIEVQDTLSEGFGIYNTKGTAAWGNTIIGSDGFDAIGLWSSTLSTVIGNNVSGFTLDPSVGFAQIYLDPSTTHDLVVCAESSDTVLNRGTDNVIIGCQQPVTTPEAATRGAAPDTSMPKPSLPRKKSL
jgi:hypothetical protein